MASFASAIVNVKPSRRATLLVVLVVAIVAAVLNIHFIDCGMPFRHNDLSDKCLAASEALHGQDPYSAQVTRDIEIAYYGRPLTPADHVPDQAFAYPPWFVLIFAPLLPLPWKSGILVYLIVAAPLLALAFFASLRSLPLQFDRIETAAAVLLALFSWPVMWSFRQAQPAILAVALTFLACWCLSRERFLSAGVLLALATVKPQIVFLLLLWLLLWTIANRRWPLLVSFGAALALLLFGSWLVVPGWLPHWLAALRTFHSLYGGIPLQFFLGRWLGLALTLIMLAAAAHRLWALRFAPGNSPQFAAALALLLGLGVCLSPTILSMTYNQMPLFPAILLLLAARPAGYPDLVRRIALVCLVWGFLAVPLAAIGDFFFPVSALAQSLPFRNMLLAPAVTAGLLLHMYASRTTAEEHSPQTALASI